MDMIQQPPLSTSASAFFNLRPNARLSVCRFAFRVDWEKLSAEFNFAGGVAFWWCSICLELLKHRQKSRPLFPVNRADIVFTYFLLATLLATANSWPGRELL